MPAKTPAGSVALMRRCARWAVWGGVALAVVACGGSDDSQVSAEVASSTMTLALEPDSLPQEASSQVAQPLFHIAPVVLNAPDDADVRDANASAVMSPKQQTVPNEFRGLSTRGLTLPKLEEVRMKAAQGMPSASQEDGAMPLAGSGVVTTYSVAQVRAAYGFSPLPAVGSKPVGAQAAALGAGQTVYIVNAMHNPNVAAELAAFNQKFGLPTCTTKVLPPGTALPLAPASVSTGCELWVAYSSAAGAITATPPAYNAGWATEIALDVQWAHAIAPLARIVLIEAPDASVNSLAAAIRLANSMGPG
ncbi:MAG: peptidase S53, partial [Acidovorax sp.]